MASLHLHPAAARDPRVSLLRFPGPVDEPLQPGMVLAEAVGCNTGRMVWSDGTSAAIEDCCTDEAICKRYLDARLLRVLALADALGAA